MSNVVKKVTELFESNALLPKHYVDLARIKASRIQRRFERPFTKAEQAVIRSIERHIAKMKEAEKFLPQTTPVVPEVPELKPVPKPKKKAAPKKTTAKRSKKTNDSTK
tara:strand:- start:363 stop:686 length:324 start_codon:yes stop_codon:yes gene_type:complete